MPAPVSVQRFCGDEVPASLKQRQLVAPDGTSLNTAWVGSGSTVAVLLHQTDGNGLCGFLFYAEFLARHGVRVALVDLCNYGQSSCGNRLTDDPAAQVKLVTDAARADGSRRIALVGASMGGSLVLTAAHATNPDAIVDLSGPAQFGSSDINTDARRVSMPALFAFSDEDRADLTAVRQQLENMPTERKLFLTYDSGHGYELLRNVGSGDFTPLATKVANWVKHQL